MDVGAVTGLGNVLAGLGDGVTGNFTAAGDRFAAAVDPAVTAEPVPRISGQPETVSAAPPWTDRRPESFLRLATKYIRESTTASSCRFQTAP